MFGGLKDSDSAKVTIEWGFVLDHNGRFGDILRLPIKLRVYAVGRRSSYWAYVERAI